MKLTKVLVKDILNLFYEGNSDHHCGPHNWRVSKYVIYWEKRRKRYNFIRV